jgi:shikimate kinase
MPGAGKSTLGRVLASRVGYSFTDLDTIIEQQEGMQVAEVFAAKGEEYFRKAEAAALAGTALLTNSVIATGGGTPCFFDNMAFMNARGLTIYLELAPGDLLERMSPEEIRRRPLLQGGNAPEKIKALLAARVAWYELARWQVPVAGRSATELAEHLLTLL